MAAIAKEGAEISTLSEEQRAILRERAQPAWDLVAADPVLGPALQALQVEVKKYQVEGAWAPRKLQRAVGAAASAWAVAPPSERGGTRETNMSLLARVAGRLVTFLDGFVTVLMAALLLEVLLLILSRQVGLSWVWLYDVTRWTLAWLPSSLAPCRSLRAELIWLSTSQRTRCPGGCAVAGLP